MIGQIVQPRIASALEPKNRLALAQRTERDLIEATLFFRRDLRVTFRKIQCDRRRRAQHLIAQMRWQAQALRQVVESHREFERLKRFHEFSFWLSETAFTKSEAVERNQKERNCFRMPYAVFRDPYSESRYGFGIRNTVYGIQDFSLLSARLPRS